MIIDGVTFTRGQVEPLLRHFREMEPTLGRNHVVREIFEQHLIPATFLAREFPEKVAEQKQRADALAQTLGQASFDDLVARAHRMPGFERREDAIREHVAIPERIWLFDDLNVGRASPVLTVPRGFSVVAAQSKTPGPTTAYDRADVCLVHFHIHGAKAHNTWLTDLRQRLAKKPAFVHPDFRDAVPPWLNARLKE